MIDRDSRVRNIDDTESAAMSVGGSGVDEGSQRWRIYLLLVMQTDRWRKGPDAARLGSDVSRLDGGGHSSDDWRESDDAEVRTRKPRAELRAFQIEQRCLSHRQPCG